GELIKSAAAKTRIPARPRMLAKTGSPRSEGWMVAADRALSGCGFHRAPFDEGKQVWVHRIGVGGAHAVRETLVDLERRLLQKLHRKQCRIGNWHDLIIVTVHDERRHVTVAHLRRAAMAPPVMGDDAVTLADEVKHLIVPIVAAQRPTVMKDNRLSGLRAPVLVKDAGAVLGCDGVHCLVPFLVLSRVQLC